MKVIKYGPGIRTYRHTCEGCATVVELEGADVRISRDSVRNEPATASYDCPGCGEKQQFFAEQLPPLVQNEAWAAERANKGEATVGSRRGR